jgi:hypothetical protein
MAFLRNPKVPILVINMSEAGSLLFPEKRRVSASAEKGDE